MRDLFLVRFLISLVTALFRRIELGVSLIRRLIHSRLEQTAGIGGPEAACILGYAGQESLCKGRLG